MPSSVLGGTTLRIWARNCRPKLGLVCHRPTARTTSPGVTCGHSPTTAAGSRWSASLTRSTQKPVSGLWKTTRSTSPDRVSAAASGAVSANGSAADAAWSRRLCCRSGCMARRT